MTESAIIFLAVIAVATVLGEISMRMNERRIEARDEQERIERASRVPSTPEPSGDHDGWADGVDWTWGRLVNGRSAREGREFDDV